MQELRCARCGREGPETQEFGAAWARTAASMDDSLPNLLADAWLNVDLCPACQTAPEQDLAARRIAEATQAAVAALAENGVDPHPKEKLVIDLTMRIQEALLGRTVRDAASVTRRSDAAGGGRDPAATVNPLADETGSSDLRV